MSACENSRNPTRHSLPVEIAASEGVLYGVNGEVCVAHLLGHGADRLDLVPGRPHFAVERGRAVVPWQLNNVLCSAYFSFRGWVELALDDFTQPLKIIASLSKMFLG